MRHGPCEAFFLLCILPTVADRGCIAAFICVAARFTNQLQPQTIVGRGLRRDPHDPDYARWGVVAHTMREPVVSFALSP